MEIPGTYNIIPGFCLWKISSERKKEKRKKNHDGLSSRVLRGGEIFYLRNSEPLFEYKIWVYRKYVEEKYMMGLIRIENGSSFHRGNLNI